MKFLLYLSRIVFGLVFIASGFLKIVDPVGTGLIVSEYFRVLFVPFLSPLAVYTGILLSMTELLLGLCILFKIRIRTASVISLYLMSFYTLLTLMLAIFNPITDCGCFGSAIHLTNWQTFFKNIVLLLCILPIYLKRRSFNPVANALAEWIFIAVYSALILTVSILSLVRIPILEFGDFKVGTNILAELDNASANVEYNTVFVYEKAGKKQRFDLDHLPDSSWTFVDSRTEKISKGSLDLFDFHVTDAGNEDMTGYLLKNPDKIVLAVITDTRRYHSADEWKTLDGIADSTRAMGGEFFILTSVRHEEMDSLAGRFSTSDIPCLYGDYKTLVSMIRSNGGIVYIKDATVVKKWAHSGLKPEKVLRALKEDYELVSTKELIYRKLVYELFIVFVLSSLLVIRLICRLIRKHKIKVSASPEQ